MRQFFAASLCCLSLASCTRKSDHHDDNETLIANDTGMMRATPFYVPGRACPPVLSAGEADIADDAPVIGIEVKGKARAYLLKSMSNMVSHVIDDLIDDVPITVTYCDQTGCAKLFTDNSRGKPLKIDTMGFSEGLLLRFQDQTYRQDNGRRLNSDANDVFPFAEYPFQLTTWKDWKNAHPETDIFTGGQPKAIASPQEGGKRRAGPKNEK